MYALKKLVVSNQTQVDEALNEIYLMNRLQNPGIVKVGFFLYRFINTTVFK